MIEKKNIPNLLTMLRLVLSAVFFLMLAMFRVDSGLSWMLVPAIILFIAAAITDALDGYYARKWHVESKFGRIMDPFCDKVLVLGALVFLAGPWFTKPELVTDDGVMIYADAVHISGVYPWMVVVIIARELLVTGIRGEMESSGHKFGANIWGKLKMILQSIVVPIVLLAVLLIDRAPDAGSAQAFKLVSDILVYATVAVTVLSGIPYITGAYRVTKSAGPGDANGSSGSDQNGS